MSGQFAIGLHMPKSNINVGSTMRAADCYGASAVITSGNRYGKSPTDTTGAATRIPLIRVDNLHDVIPFGCVPVAVDLVDDAVSLVDYIHPKNAFYVFGPEDGTLGEKVLGWCRDKVYVPTKFCMNLAATVNVVLYDRLLKETLQGKLK